MILLNLLYFVGKLFPQNFYSSEWADQRSPLRDIENDIGGRKKNHAVVLVSDNISVHQSLLLKPYIHHHYYSQVAVVETSK